MRRNHAEPLPRMTKSPGKDGDIRNGTHDMVARKSAPSAMAMKSWLVRVANAWDTGRADHEFQATPVRMRERSASALSSMRTATVVTKKRVPGAYHQRIGREQNIAAFA